MDDTYDSDDEPIPRTVTWWPPGPEGFETWSDYWQAHGVPWRTEPEIDSERQQSLAQRMSMLPDAQPDVEPGCGPLQGIDLSRADVEWLIATCGSYGSLDLRCSDLREVDLRSLDLSSANLSGADRERANLSGCALPGILLWKAKLFEADLSETNLAGANLVEADLCSANLHGALLRGADLSGASLENAYLAETDLRDANLTGAVEYGQPG